MSTEPNSGLEDFRDFGQGASGWDEPMIANLLRIGRVGFHLAPLDRDLNAPPAEPEDGDLYIVAGAATGDWEGHEDEVAVWDDADQEWQFYAPRTGWVAFIVDEGVLSAFVDGAGWTSGVDLDPA